MAYANTKIGDIFCVKLDNNRKKHLQYVASDLTQLNSDVIRVFKIVYPTDCKRVSVDSVDVARRAQYTSKER